MSNETKRCEEIRGLLADRALGQLDAGAAGSVERHLADCAACREYAGQVESALGLVEPAPSITPSDDFDAELSVRIEAERERERAERTTALTVLVAAFQHLRRLGVGAAIYVVVGLALGYVAGSMIPRATTTPGTGEPKVFGLWNLPERQARREAPSPAMKPNAKDLELAGPDLFVPEMIDLEVAAFEPPPLRMDAAEEPLESIEDPKTIAELRSLPVSARRLILPSGGPGGSALARARRSTIRNSKLRGLISAGLVWLCRNQGRSGSWTAGPDSPYSDVEVTAAGALAFMESGFAPSGKSRVCRNLRGALTWLIRQKRRAGRFEVSGRRRLPAQALAVTALSEALRLSDRETIRRRFRPVVQAALEALVESQGQDGKWGNAEQTTMVLMAMGAARGAGLAVDAPSHELAVRWLDAYGDRSDEDASLPPSARGGESASYAIIGGVLGEAESVLGSSEAATHAGRSLAGPESQVVWAAGDFFRWYAATLAAYRLDGYYWHRWNRELCRQLVSRSAQRPARAGEIRGSWEPHGASEKAGRAYCTAMAVCSLAASHGHSPVYGSGR